MTAERCFDCEATTRPLTKMALMESPERYCFSICGFCRPKWNEALVEFRDTRVSKPDTDVSAGE